MVTKEMVSEASKKGLQGLKELVENLPKEDVLKAIGLMVLLGVSYAVIEAVKEIVLKGKQEE